ncbi:MAG: GSU3473 family protein [bacterium]
MLIHVQYTDDKYDMIKPKLLDEFILQGEIKKFKRADGWAVIGVDKIRGDGGHYEGKERRQQAY